MKIQPKVIVIGLMATIVLAGGGVLAASALRQPEIRVSQSVEAPEIAKTPRISSTRLPG